MWPLMGGDQPVTVGSHDGPVKEIAWIPQWKLLVTGSWDKTLRCVYVCSFCFFAFCLFAF